MGSLGFQSVPWAEASEASLGARGSVCAGVCERASASNRKHTQGAGLVLQAQDAVRDPLQMPRQPDADVADVPVKEKRERERERKKMDERRPKQ